MINSIYLREDKFKEYNTIDDDRTIRNLSKINIFIGSNNSGKSRCLRTIFSDNELRYNSDTLDITVLNSIIDEFKQELKEGLDGLVEGAFIVKRFIEDFKALDFCIQH
ncbi:hypothetical protein [Mucilaginibacter psychrotolerans]|uniref:AAA domain-containing protein n=1 Tax=Mucilaginibacter psychrotolerans TaxID=1524096 RepID=A0A4Y8S445_9SPHI|nr:hypothetical protein [Mucilaginibacter psychrotolerans]TFF33506.1 hypothetical protein E2R66_25355 [Mucilaginibacter psychrotolerans]